MEEVVVGGKRLVAAKIAARRVGYHPDYVGQLCRSGLITCEKVGRTWFVWEEDLARHKLTTHIREDESSGDSVVIRRKDDFSPSRREIVASLAERVRCYPASGVLAEALPRYQNTQDSEAPTLPPLHPRLKPHPEEEDSAPKTDEVRSQPLEKGGQFSEGERFSEGETGDLLKKEERRKQLPPPPLPSRPLLRTEKEVLGEVKGVQVATPRGSRKAQWERLLATGLGLLIASVVVLAALFVRTTVTCYPLTGCEEGYEVVWSLPGILK